MSMWYMTTKTFKKVFVKAEAPKHILTTQYVVVSSRIRKTGENQNVVSVHKLFPKAEILSDYRCELDKNYLKNEYFKQLDKNKVVLAVLIRSAIDYKMPIVFICTPKEYKLKYFKYLREYVEKEFHYPILNYLKYKEKKEKSTGQFNTTEVLEACDKVIKEQRKKTKKDMMKTKEGRKKLVAAMSKDEMKEQLKELCLYSDNMTKAEMREMLQLFFVS